MSTSAQHHGNKCVLQPVGKECSLDRHTSAACCSCSWVAALHTRGCLMTDSGWCSSQGCQTSHQACRAMRKVAVCTAGTLVQGSEHVPEYSPYGQSQVVKEYASRSWHSRGYPACMGELRSGAYHEDAPIRLSWTCCRRGGWLGKCGRRGSRPLL